MYKAFLRPILFLFDPEAIHHFVFGTLKLFGKVPGARSVLHAIYGTSDQAMERTLMGLTFKNPVGLAAGFDKDARLIDEMAALGFGFIEIGTLTPRPQAGNEKPRLFRLPLDQALINRMGFNNLGVIDAVKRLQKRTSTVIVGGNIGKNKDTPNDRAFEDYTYCIEALYPHVDYFVVNVSSPNTPALRELQGKEPLKRLLTNVKDLIAAKEKAKPVLLKIAPDLSVEQLDDIIAILKETKTDGVIATNTTTSREGLLTPASNIQSIGAGGLSGRPLRAHATAVISYLRKQLGPNYPIIGVGGIMSPEDAKEKIKAGANLVQIYTGFVYEGPGFVKRINRALRSSVTH